MASYSGKNATSATINFDAEGTGSLGDPHIPKYVEKNSELALTNLGAVNESASASDTASSGLNGRLQRVAQRLTSLIALFPSSIGQKAKNDSLSVTLASNHDTIAISDGSGSLTVDGTLTANQGGNWDIRNISGTVPLPTGAATSANQSTTNTIIGAINETAPATDTANSGLNGRLQRIAQRLTNLLALFPSSIGQKVKTDSLSVVLASNHDSVVVSDGSSSLTVDGTLTANQGGAWDVRDVTGSLPLPTGAATSANQSTANTLVGALTETAPASDTASSGLNGRLQRVAQRLSSLITLLPTSIGQKTKTASLAVAIASDQVLPISDNDASLTVDGTVAATQSGNWDIRNVTGTIPLATGAATAANQFTTQTLIGAASETAPGTDTEDSGLNGRLKRVAQRLTTLITTIETRVGSLTETAASSDTASSGLNGRLQRIAQRLTSLIALMPQSLGPQVKSASLSVTLASDTGSLPVAITPQVSSTASPTRISISTASATLLSANTNRIGAIIYNEGAAALFVKLGASASTTSYTVKLASGAFYVVPEVYTGRIDGVTDTGTGAALATEIVK